MGVFIMNYIGNKLKINSWFFLTRSLLFQHKCFWFFGKGVLRTAQNTTFLVKTKTV